MSSTTLIKKQINGVDVRNAICPLCGCEFTYIDTSTIDHIYRLKNTKEICPKTKCLSCFKEIVLIPNELKATTPDDERLERFHSSIR